MKSQFWRKSSALPYLRYGLLFVLSVICGSRPTVPAWAGASASSDVVIRFHPVGTPEFMGAPKIGQPGFIPPVLEELHQPEQASCLHQEKVGEYEALIAVDGSVSTVRSHHEPVDGDKCEQKYLFPFILKWHFKPATFEGKPTPVYMWFGLN